MSGPKDDSLEERALKLADPVAAIQVAVQARDERRFDKALEFIDIARQHLELLESCVKEELRLAKQS